MEFLSDYGLFLAKTLTLVLAILFLSAGLFALSSRHRKGHEGHLEVTHWNEELTGYRHTLEGQVLPAETARDRRKSEQKAKKAAAKARRKALKNGRSEEDSESARPRTFVLDFDGDIRASAVDELRECITALLTVKEEKDDVVVRIESPGGLVHSYGLAASQLARIREARLPLTVCVDKVAASGGYLMACIADRIVAAPFAILGSIGVVAQLPNFNRLLKRHDIDFEVMTAGEYKRTLTIFGENTEQGREKFRQDLEETHELFKQWVREHRPIVDIEEVSKGEIWFGRRALEQKLIDELATSDGWLQQRSQERDIYRISYKPHRNLAEKMGFAFAQAGESLWLRIQRRLSQANPG